MATAVVAGLPWTAPSSLFGSPMNRNSSAAMPLRGAASTAQQKNCSFDLSGCREYVGSATAFPQSRTRPGGLISPEILGTTRFALRLISVCRKAKILNQVVKCLGRVAVSGGPRQVHLIVVELLVIGTAGELIDAVRRSADA